MVALTRQDCLIGSSALMRQALVQAAHHARHRRAFGKALIEQPLMRNVLADLALESEAATALTFRVARAVDASGRSDNEAALARVIAALGKYWVCKRCTPFVNEAQECLGGIGYVEDTPMPRLLRQAPLPGRAARPAARAGLSRSLFRRIEQCPRRARVARCRDHATRTHARR
jgi:putative acyl-CoA dehydrogenase